MTFPRPNPPARVSAGREVLSDVRLSLAQALRENRKALAAVFAESLAPTPKWNPVVARNRDDWDAFLELEFFAFVDYIAEYFARGDETFRNLFLGEKIKSLYDPSLDDAARKAQPVVVADSEREGLERILRSRVSEESWTLLETFLHDAFRILSAENARVQRILLIGDCLFLDIVPFIAGDLLRAGIAVQPDYATSKNPVELREQLRALSSRMFDMVFYSPFSYEFAPEYAQLANWRMALNSTKAIDGVVQKTWRDTKATLDVIVDLFDCPIHVHNSAFIVREEGTAKRLVKAKATAVVRSAARRHINDLLAQYVHRKAAESFKPLFVLDEHAVAQEHGESAAGAFYYRTMLQHPAVFGKLLAATYVDLITVNAHLLRKKLVVCDLDNTLWRGLIGEGAVSHYHDRQQILKSLKGKGVVLAINSKNDPAKVNWESGTLSEADFVSASISWNPKIEGMRRIQKDLNLKMKDFVFVDDREDELELIRMTYPEITCLSSTDPATWRRLQTWANALEENSEMDRTVIYQQREKREAFVSEAEDGETDKVSLFSSLQLRLSISRAQFRDLKRVAELINRTNQFNLEGSRTSIKEVVSWHESSDHHILLGQTADRFGDMGTTCIAVTKIEATDMVLLPFVLSCRVFGYGIERAVMNHIKTIAASRGINRIIGRFVRNQHNSPCATFLADNGFVQEGDKWICHVREPAPANPEWLEVRLA